jgi:hypothetical protein
MMVRLILGSGFRRDQRMFSKTLNSIFGCALFALALIAWFRLAGKMSEWRSRLYEKRNRLQTLFGSDDKKL